MSKRVIRQGSFETNSSSMHSICKMTSVNEEKMYNDIYIDQNGVWDLSDHEELSFGRYPFQILTSPHEKAKYAIASLVRYKGDEAYQQIFNAMKNVHPELKDIHLNVDLRRIKYSDYDMEFVKKYYGDNYIISNDNIIYWGDELGWVDSNILGPFLKKYDISIEQFITDRHIIVICDGDEYCQFLYAKEAGIINEDNIEIEYPDRKKEDWWEEIKD